MAITLDGTSGITFPNSTVQASAGKILQVVQGLLTTQVATSTYNTFVTTGLTASITPTSSTSKILATVSGTGFTGASAVQGVFTLYRNSTNLSTYGFTTVYTSSTSSQAGIAFSYLDSPATTSATSYTLYFMVTNSAGTVTFNSPSGYGQGTATIILQEVAA
jgi:hypothetical protein